MNEVTKPPEALPEAPEAETLARELTAAYRAYVEHYRRVYKTTGTEAMAHADEPGSPAYEEMLLQRPADEVSWHDLQYVAERDPERMTQGWEKIKQVALHEVQCGHRAAIVLEGAVTQPWKRALFLALRKEISSGWQPRNGVERQLIDTMAQAQAAVLFWQERLFLWATTDPVNEKKEDRERAGWLPPRVSASEAVDQAAAMVDRFNRMFLRTLRAFCNLRKVPLAVVVQNAGQVNVGQQQVNVTG
jgi:hypothetical protein